ncbi:uncharacterized protein HD556DRAFT_1369130 [Suillus plorans]|uniref:Uncharacterized protein n=1 Tax=Suillus plorans TaxID=116603 RepID=A0A9P7AR36_9AGAM|nr:uncharacterized protein HD556DRAFT_1369130 [Suillus plorans]KAG1794661.1 hypothetical protein HD556DRAFT_1369130 [Suillus plorans]
MHLARCVTMTVVLFGRIETDRCKSPNAHLTHDCDRRYSDQSALVPSALKVEAPNFFSSHYSLRMVFLPHIRDILSHLHR